MHMKPPSATPLLREHIAGVILAGGASRRMGGVDKCLVDLGGQPILARIIARLRPQVAHLALSANGDAARFAAFGLPVLPDREGQHDGPLSGVLAGLTWAGQQPNIRAIVTVSSDLPFLPLDLVPRLFNADGALRVARSGDRVHPTVALWPLAILDAVASALAQRRRKAMAFVEAHNAHYVTFPFEDGAGHPVDPFFNANTPDDLDAARRLLQTSDP